MSKTAWSSLAVVTILIAITAVVLVVMPSKKDETTPVETPNVKVEQPRSGATVGNTFTVKGEALGTWFFEASFPIEVRDPDGKVIGQSHAEAQGDWMTENFVPFTATISVTDFYTGPATLVLQKDNPSDLPQNADSVSFPITISK